MYNPTVKNRTLAYDVIVIGALFIIFSIVYFTTPAGFLPSYMPGYILGSGAIHVKHGIAMLILSLGSFVFAWFQTGTKQN